MRRRTTVVSWLLVLGWMALIFVGSSDVLSENNTSRFLLPLLHRLFPFLSDATIHDLQAVIRKGGHVTEYGILALLALRALRPPAVHRPRLWAWRPAWLALGLCCLYAISDEIHQSFVSSRYGSAIDVLIDTAGAGLALTAAWGLSRLRRPGDPPPSDHPGPGTATLRVT